MSIAAAVVLAGAAQAEIIQCERTKLSTAGFTSASVAASWYPEELFFEFSGEKLTRSSYGEGIAEPDGNRITMTFRLTSSRGADTTMIARYFPGNKRLSVTKANRAGFKVTTPSRYRCVTR